MSLLFRHNAPAIRASRAHYHIHARFVLSRSISLASNYLSDPIRSAAMSTVLTIQASIAGLVIGRQGNSIKHIQDTSGAAVKVVSGNTHDTCKVIVTGNGDAQKKATVIIQEIAKEKVLKVEFGPAPMPRSRRQWSATRSRDVSSPKPAMDTNTPEWAAVVAKNAERKRLYLKTLPRIVKAVYREHDHVKSVSVESVCALRLAQNVTVEYAWGDTSLPIPKPVETFEHAFHMCPEIMELIKKQQFTHPTAVQRQAWPIILSGHDLIAIAQTGTGKTLAYILPALVHLISQPTPRNERIGPSVVILGPTRELVLQIEKEINKYVFDGISVLCLYGGVSSEPQANSLFYDGPDIIVATPGRLKELVGICAAKLQHVSYLVLDEADRMLDMGFKNQIEMALKHVRPDKQTILTSATWPKSVVQLANNFTRNPVQVKIDDSHDLSAVNMVEQKVIVLKEHEKWSWLEEFMKTNLSKEDKVIIFLRTKMAVEKLNGMFKELNIGCRCIHSKRLQVNREQSLADFREGVVSILLATDIMSRGLDINNITFVINFDFPLEIEDYIHRVGRTGRAGKSGSAISLFTYKDKKNAFSLVNILKNSKQSVPQELLGMVIKP